jgi:hypothetical protein
MNRTRRTKNLKKRFAFNEFPSFKIETTIQKLEKEKTSPKLIDFYSRVYFQYFKLFR